ncbi:MAG: hydrogenase maturation protease [Bacteroidales bacterium]
MSDRLTALLSAKDRKILFVGIGNLLRQDDGIGVFISNRLKERDNLKVITAEASIENYIGKINSVEHDTLVLIDCVDMKRPPGSFDLLPVDRVRDLTFNTHNISLKRISEFFRNEVLILAIQPEKVGFGENLSYIVELAGNKIVELINKKEV